MVSNNIYDKIENYVLEKIKPKKEEYEKLLTAFNIIKNRIEEVLKENRVEAKITLQGSIAHDTWLSGDHDLDIFVLFPLDWSIETLRDTGFKLLLKAAQKIGKYEIRYAEHPYIKVYIGEVEADLVPGYDVSSHEDVRTAVDRTPLHTRYVNSKLNDYMRDQVRLLKKFLKNLGIYGAEIKTKGFSGYVAELLIIMYGSFRNLLREASKWKHPVYINTLGNREKFRYIIKIFKKKYPDAVMYLPDPVDPLRNAAASVSLKSLATFVVASKCYLRNPDTVFFFDEQIYDLETITKSLDHRCLLIVELPLTEKLPPDILWGELLRIGDRGAKVLINNDFNVIYWDVWSDEEKKCYILYELDCCEKKTPRLYEGPEYWAGDRVLRFIAKHVERGSIGPWFDLNGRLDSLGKRKYDSAQKLLVERSWEYIVTPHFKGLVSRVYVVTKELLEEMWRSGGISKWLVKSILRRPKWMEKCTI